MNDDVFDLRCPVGKLTKITTNMKRSGPRIHNRYYTVEGKEMVESDYKDFLLRKYTGTEREAEILIFIIGLDK